MQSQIGYAEPGFRQSSSTFQPAKNDDVRDLKIGQ
jgi:hypothetical protein